MEHEVLYSLGLKQEQQRPDRDDYIIVNETAIPSEIKESFYKINNWMNASESFPFEVESVMMYCSYCGSYLNGSASITLLNGDTFEKSLRMTTTDSRQVIENYCRGREDVFDHKKTVQCTSEDRVVSGLYREVYVDRICDGFVDCPEAEDELGGLGACITFQTNTPTIACCSIIEIDSIECHYDLERFNGRNVYKCEDDDNHVILHMYGKWLETRSGFPSMWGYNTWNYIQSDNICPPIGPWTTNGRQLGYVFCMSSGVDDRNGCECTNSHTTCVEQLDGNRCDCEFGYAKNGNSFEVDGGVCDELHLGGGTG